MAVRKNVALKPAESSWGIAVVNCVVRPSIIGEADDGFCSSGWC